MSAIKENLNNISFIFILFILVSCSSKKLEKTELIKWVENTENGLVKEKEIDAIKFRLQYQPPIVSALKGDPNINSENLKAKLDEYSDYEYFVLRIQGKNGQEPLEINNSSETELSQRIIYLSFEAQKDFMLITDSDTLPCVMYHFERNYNSVNYDSFILTFPKTKSASDNIIISYNDHVWGMGKVNFEFDRKVITSIPELKF